MACGPSLSSDVDVTMAQDPFTVMRACFTLQRLNVLQRARRGEQNLPPLLTTREVLEFATVDGARCLALENKIGTLTPGKEADIVMLAADRLNVWPLNNVPGAVVNLMNPMNVDTVFIAGKVKKWRGGLVGVDVARVLRLVAGGARRRDRAAPASRQICSADARSMHRAAVRGMIAPRWRITSAASRWARPRQRRAVAGKPRGEIGGIEAVAGRHGVDRHHDLRHRHELALAAGRDQRAVRSVLDHDLADAERLQPLDRRLRARVAPQHGLVVICRHRDVDALERLHEHRAGAGHVAIPAARAEIAVEGDLDALLARHLDNREETAERRRWNRATA